jgi:D-alanine-D-alanine ligase
VIKKKKVSKRMSYKKRGVIALVYHYVPKKTKEEFFNTQQALVDNQTDEIVSYMKRLFIRRGYRVQMLKVSPDNLTDLKKLKADFVFNLVDSKAMEVRIAKILDRIRIPHSGSSFEAIKTSNNKIKSKRLFQKNKLPTPSYSLITPTIHISRALLPGKFPIIVKPAFEHCSIGITDNSIATTYEQFKRIIRVMRKKYKQTLLAEQFIPGKELQVTVMETPNKTIALPIAEIAFKKMFQNKWNIYGFDEKWSKNLPAYKSCHFVAPPKRLNINIDAQIKRDSIRAFYALGMKDYARFDLRYNPSNHQWYFLEANANAGFDPDERDAMTVSVQAHGMTLDDFVLQIVKNSIN